MKARVGETFWMGYFDSDGAIPCQIDGGSGVFWSSNWCERTKNDLRELSTVPRACW